MPVAAVVPLALLLLARTGQRPSDLGLTGLGWPDFGLAVGGRGRGFGCELLLAIPFAPLEHSAGEHLRAAARSGLLPDLRAEPGLVHRGGRGDGIRLSDDPAGPARLVTRRAFWLSLALRTSYHLYYGIAAC